VQKELSSDSDLDDMDFYDISEFDEEPGGAEFDEEPGGETARASFPKLTDEIRNKVNILSKN
jgi:hypothetical protein